MSKRQRRQMRRALVGPRRVRLGIFQASLLTRPFLAYGIFTTPGDCNQIRASYCIDWYMISASTGEGTVVEEPITQ